MTSPSPSAPILVTGAHRTGTTWVGKMLTASGQAAYISEPLNVLHRPGVLITPTRYWYTYICAENEAQYLPGLRQTFGFRYHPLAELASLRSRKDAMRMGRDLSTFMRGWLAHQRPLLKDPFALFSAPWFADRLGCQVVITVRHPAAFASSLKRLDWPFNFQDLLDQPLLMRDWLAPFEDDMRRMLQGPQDIIAQGSLLWRVVYAVVHQMRQRYPHFIVVRHEDLSLDPQTGYRQLYASLGLDFTAQAQETIASSSSSENPKEVSKNAAFAVRLDSRANLHNWKRRLQPEEIERIRQLTQDVDALYYPDEPWN